MVKILLIALSLISIFSCSSSNDEMEVIPTLTIPDIERLEGDEGVLKADLIITVMEAHTKDIMLSYHSDDGSAFQDFDYKKIEGNITIPAGKTEGTIAVEIISDNILEGNELFKIIFDTEQEINVNQMTASVRIKNDDSTLPYDLEDYNTPNSYAGWILSWADEFSGSEINTNWWTHEIGNGDNGWGNNEMQYYTNASGNSRIKNGNLVIEARNDFWNGSQQYTSARLVTKDKKMFVNGRVDIRAKLPSGQGIWPALWMLGNNIDERGWPACGEIDIMELIGNKPSISHATVHFGADFSNKYKYVGDDYRLSGEIFNDRFHVFSVVREFNQMWFYVDDILIFEFTSKDTQGQPYPFNEQFFFIFNVAIGGNWPGNPDATTIFPQEMVVDYVRVFEKE